VLNLAVNRAVPGEDVPAVEIDQPIPGDLPEPRIEGHRTIPEILGKLAEGLDERFLNHVRGVEARGEPGIHAHRDHPPQSGAMTVDEPAGR
jgi:hypothetical protein